MENVDQNDVQEKHGVWGRSPQKILTYFEVQIDFDIHEFTLENHVTFQKSGVAGGVSLCKMGKDLERHHNYHK